ncbi:cupin domain-containing protein [Microbulbifer sp. JMSA003]|uniref:cupin domain-containing protein n=1 Tax=Microbulbifer sp. JMSA003 TaxID=3243369 RepID=UPI0040398D50
MKSVIKLDPHNPSGEGLESWAVIPPSFLTGPTPIQRGYKAFERNGLCTGTWDCSGGSSTGLNPYPLFEFMLLIEDHVGIIDETEHKEVISAGEPFFLPQGLNCAWDMPVYYRKYFINLFNDEYPAETDPSKLRVVRPLPNISEDDCRETSLSALEPHQARHLAYESGDGRIQVGTLISGPCHCDITDFSRSELICMLEGSVRVTTSNGEETFLAGDSFFIPLNAPVGWHADKPFRAFFCAVWP